jgi:glycosyltransferase involved in cell wall biosynthesis
MKTNPPTPNFYLEAAPMLRETLPILAKQQFKNSKDMIVFSHLRWEFVKQRPQHLLERMAKNRKILFVEEPIEHSQAEYGTVRKIRVGKNITVIQPKIRVGDFFTLNQIVKKYTSNFTNKPVLWFYSPAFINMLLLIPHSAVVYDCMDELSQFKNAPKKLVTQEKRLLQFADVVFTGGQSLFNAKKKYHQNIYNFPSSVDSQHFAKVLQPRTKIPSDLKNITKPVVGFYGVVDERLDLKLISDIAELMPQVSFVIIGPLAKIEENDLPQAKNIHYLGAKDYSQLPNYLKGFDIAFMPFALNEATEFISPTKTLEFMAANKPIISTPIYDVVQAYSDMVTIVRTAKQMKQAITRHLQESDRRKKHRLKLQQTVIKNTSWDRTARTMSHLIDEVTDGYRMSTESIYQNHWYSSN